MTYGISDKLWVVFLVVKAAVLIVFFSTGVSWPLYISLLASLVWWPWVLYHMVKERNEDGRTTEGE